MSYTRTTWQPGVAGGTKITASRLNNIEQGIVDAASSASDPAIAAIVANPASQTATQLSTTIVATGDARYATPSVDKKVFVSRAGNDSNNGLTVGKAKLTIAGALTALSGGGVIQIGSGTFTEPNPLTIPNDTTMRGVGDATQIVFTTPNVSQISLVNQARVKFRDMKLSLSSTATGGTVLDISNSFRCSFRGVTFSGQHTLAVTDTYKTQVGIRLRDNAGDNRFVDCDINNFGIGVYTDTIQNYFVGCTLGSNYRSVVGGDATGVAYIAGISMTGCTMVSAGATVTYRHVDILGTANTFWFANCWAEGASESVVVGNSSGGPAVFGMINTKIAGTSKCLNIVAASQPVLMNVQFSADSSATPIELTIASTVVSGVAQGLVSSQAYEIPLSVFPAGWTYIPRSNTESSQIAGRTLSIGVSGAAGQISYFQSGGGRARIGYDGTRTIVSDAGGGRDVVLRSGATARDLVTADSSGVLHLGQKAASNGGMVKGVFVADATTVPNANPAGGGFLYSEGGALKWRGSSGTVTVLGPA